MEAETLGPTGQQSDVSHGARKFRGRVQLAPFAQMDYWFLVRPLVWSSVNIEPHKIEIPRGFVTDFASIPWPFWSIFPPIGSYGMPAIMHDWLYWTQIVDRKQADAIFHVAMVEMQTPGWKRYVIYGALRLFGWTAWRNNARAKLRGEKRVLKSFPNDPHTDWIHWRANPGVFG